MFLKLQLITLNIGATILLMLFLCLGSQNLRKKSSLSFLTTKTVPLPIGFLVGTSFALGVMSGGLTSALTITNTTNEEN